MTFDNKVVRPIAIYLPQFHPIPQNDKWWGKGFTEWTNVTKAKSLFKGHYQPHLPADLGFYDLRLPEARLAQADLAKEYGIYGFCYYHYWFTGETLLERPVNDMLNSGQPDFPFMLCWANENWTRRWDGTESDVLMQQNYSEQDDLAHIRHLCKYFADKRYIRIDGKPFFIFYRTSLFPNMKRTAEIFRQEAQRLGIGELYLAYMESFGEAPDPASLGLDASVEFPPHSRFDYGAMRQKPSFIKALYHKIRKTKPLEDMHRIVDYAAYAKSFLAQPLLPHKLFPAVTPMWDNSARKKEWGLILKDSTPEIYETWLRDTIKKFKPYSAEENFVFINAWNEWAEGNHLEPCRKWGRSYLEATQRAITGK